MWGEKNEASSVAAIAGHVDELGPASSEETAVVLLDIAAEAIGGGKASEVDEDVAMYCFVSADMNTDEEDEEDEEEPASDGFDWRDEDDD